MHPGFAPYRRALEALGGFGTVPAIDELNRVARASRLALPDGTPLRFEMAPPRRTSALQYERKIGGEGAIEFRQGNWHDFANALVWLEFPLIKAALTVVHLRDGLRATPNRRSRARDAATLFDEAGLIFVCADAEMIALLRAWEWRELFWTRRDDVAQSTQAIVVGHGLLERLRAPYRALTAQALMVQNGMLRSSAQIDAAAAALIRADDFAPQSLTPLPIAALPGWDTERLGERLFDDSEVFRRRR